MLSGSVMQLCVTLRCAPTGADQSALEPEPRMRSDQRPSNCAIWGYWTHIPTKTGALLAPRGWCLRLLVLFVGFLEGEAESSAVNLAI